MKSPKRVRTVNCKVDGRNVMRDYARLSEQLRIRLIWKILVLSTVYARVADFRIDVTAV